MTQNRNAYIGRNIEILFKNSIGDNPRVIQKIQGAFNIQSRFLNAISTGIQAEKVDVKLEFADGHNIDANIKAFKKTGSSQNQITRTTITHFCEHFGLVNEEQELKDLFLIKAKNKNAPLFNEANQIKWIPIFTKIASGILTWSFSYRQSREILVIYERNDSNMYIYLMKDIMRNLDKQVSITSRGNILIGKSVIFQRKGGNGVHAKRINKLDPKHPGNDVQIKLKMKDFIEEMSDLLLVSYHI